MGALEFRKNEWSLLADVIYLDLANDNASRVGLPGGDPIVTNVDLGLTGWQLGLYGGYQLYRTERASLDLLAGTRHLSLDADAKLDISGPLLPGLPTARLSRSASLWDPVVGIRRPVELDHHWFVPYRADIDAGDSDLTWQAMMGIDYDPGWVDVTMAYRRLT